MNINLCTEFLVLQLEVVSICYRVPQKEMDLGWVDLDLETPLG